MQKSVFLSSDLSRDHLPWNRNIKYRHFYEASQAARHLSAVRDSLLNKLRVKRSALFSTGVIVCPQENMAEVIAGHKSYYKLRGWTSHIASYERDRTKVRAKFVSTRASPCKWYLACLSSEAFRDRKLH